MKQYELTVLIHPDLEMNLTPATDKVSKLIEANGGKITKETNEGKKRLAYKIGESEYAVYYYYEVDLPADAPRKISSTLNITDEVLRYLLVKADERKRKLDAKRQTREGDEAEATADDATAETESSESNDNTEE